MHVAAIAVQTHRAARDLGPDSGTAGAMDVDGQGAAAEGHGHNAGGWAERYVSACGAGVEVHACDV